MRCALDKLAVKIWQASVFERHSLVKKLSKTFPFRDIFTQFLKEYSESAAYWYAPKWRVLNDDNIKVMTQILKVIFHKFLEDVWNVETQDKILTRLKKLKILRPYKKGKKINRTALTRICKILLEALGLLWVQKGKEIVITDAGLDLLSAQRKEWRQIIERQIIKYQYPNPSLSGPYAKVFGGLLPHVFLLQVLRECENRITKIEFELFVNLAKSQEDLDRIVRYVNFWREIDEHGKQIILNEVKKIIIPGEKQTRFKRIKQDASYQRPFFTYPNYLEVDRGDIVCREPDKVNKLLDKLLRSFKVTIFSTTEDWFAYYGNPRKEPSWSTYLITMIENAAKTEEVEHTVRTVMEEYKEVLTPEETEEIEKAQVEKDIETFYFAHPERLEKGLVVNSRQFPTPIGRIDLLCKSNEDEYVVVEIKADEARDSVFGQILRYIGWFHRNIPKAKDNVRGIILASRFPETAHYSRIGLLKPDYKRFIQFHECKL